MRRALLLMTLFVLAFPAAAAADGASVKLLDCVPALEPQDRMAMFEGRMTPRRGSERMQLRFTLQVREPAVEWRRVVAPGLDQWLTSNPGVRRYSYAKTVQNLAAPAAYRMVMRFRWLDAAGAVMARSRATSRACRQPDLRPELEALAVEVSPAVAPDRRRFAITVRNRGRIAAGPFASEAIAEIRNTQFVHFCTSVGDEQTAQLYAEIIQPEEIHHHHLGREILEKYAATPELQELAAAAVRNTLAIADELSNLAAKTTGVHNIPVS